MSRGPVGWQEIRRRSVQCSMFSSRGSVGTSKHNKLLVRATSVSNNAAAFISMITPLISYLCFVTHGHFPAVHLDSFSNAKQHLCLGPGVLIMHTAHGVRSEPPPWRQESDSRCPVNLGSGLFPCLKVNISKLHAQVTGGTKAGLLLTNVCAVIQPGPEFSSNLHLRAGMKQVSKVGVDRPAWPVWPVMQVKRALGAT